MIEEQLNKLAAKHETWVGLVKGMGCNPAYVDDVVQDAYIRVYEYLSKGVDISYGEDDVNDFYMYMTLRSIYLNGLKKKSVYNEMLDVQEEKLEYVLGNIKNEYADVEQEKGFNKLISKIFTEVNSWDFYSRNVFIAYFTTGLSLDKLSNETGIGRSSLYNSIRRYRDIIRQGFSEDAEDYYNGDYDKI
jgi:DNA-directed RNA polymerase specialized sigma24 family protein